MRLNAFILGALLLLIVTPATAQGADRPIVAVFNIEAKGIRLSGEVLDRLTDALGSMIASQGYQVVPRSALKDRLLQQKSISKKLCYDTTCQIELGKELAAQKSLASQLIKLGKSCKISLAVYDLKKAASELGAYESGECDEDALAQSLERAVQRLIGETSLSSSINPEKGIGSGPLTGTLRLDTVPWCEIYDGDKRLGMTPLVDVELSPGVHRLKAVNKSRSVERIIKVTIKTDETTTMKVNLE